MKLRPCVAVLTLLTSLFGNAGAGEPKLTNYDINSPSDEDDPFVVADGKTMFFATNRAGTYDIYIAKRATATQLFKTSKAFLDSKDDDERSPFVYKEQDLFFAHNHVPDEKLKKFKNFDIVKKTGERAPIPLLGISEAEDELHPWITPAGKEFYFSRKTKEGWVLMLAKGPTPGPIGEAKPLEFPPDFCHATLNAATLTMYLQGPLEKGRTGIFRSRRTSVKSAWSQPEPIEELDHPDAKRGALSPCLAGDRLYFVSDRPGGKGGLDIWSVLTSQLK